ncbi:MAG: hypothetical protein KDK70_07250 [Myxococcales bacterium]|nr:hypothetical protein [Myxococcales bacterium]
MDLPIASTRLALLTVTLALGCAVGDENSSFTGLTFGDASAEGGPGGTTQSDGTDGTNGTDADGTGTGSADGTSNGSADEQGCTPSEEICDGEDNDCDGEIDNGDPDAGAPCDTGLPGVCANGTTACEDGAVACIPNQGAVAETCNGLDDDCNGMIDDGNPEGGQACNTGMSGICADGITECMVGALGCLPTVMSSPEVCDNLDNDCDGTVDDGNPGGGGACATGMPGICSAGTNQCSGGVVSCQPNQMAAPAETCNNGLDDNCNGQVDEMCSTCSHDICLTGDPLIPGCEPCVTSVCGIDPFCCSVSWDAFCVDEVGSVCGIVC